MMPEVLAAPLGLVWVALLAFVNRRVWGFLPDDPPTGTRKRHDRRLPMVGVGLGLVATVLLAALTAPCIAAGALVCTTVGYLDDRRKEYGGGLALLWKVMGLAIAAGLATASLDGGLGAFGVVLAIALAFVVINAVNFLDNANGVATAVGAIGLLLASGGHGALAAVGWLFVGFLPFNWPTSRLLLGDAGAFCLGYALGVAALHHGFSAGAVNLPAVLAPVAVPVLDFVQVVCARLYLGFAPWIGDRRHLTHIAMNTGLPPVLVAPAFALLALGLFAMLA